MNKIIQSFTEARFWIALTLVSTYCAMLLLKYVIPSEFQTLVVVSVMYYFHVEANNLSDNVSSQLQTLMTNNEVKKQ